MANQLPLYFDPEKLGRRRFPDNKSYRAQLNSEASKILSAMLDLFPSNYPKDPSTNLSILYRSLAREAARQQESDGYINNDKVYTDTRIQYLQQILGERLFLNQQLVPVTSNDVDYRNFLISIKDAYLAGSKKSVIEGLINSYTKLKVNLKELYLEARKPGSAYGLIDTHKMVIEVFVDDLIASGMDIATINNNLSFFVNVSKPAHVLYDTKLIWTETLVINKIHDLIYGDLGGGCVPKYIYTPFNEKTVLAVSIVVVDPNNPPSTNNIYTIGSILPEDLVIYTTDDTKVIVEPGTDGTKFFGANGRRILFSDLQIGQTIMLVSLAIPGDFNFYYLPPDLVTDYDSRFYKDIYRKPAFQEFVKKQMDSKGRFPLQIATTPTTFCDRWVTDALQPMYEDMRKDCKEKAEKAHTYSVTLSPRMWSPRFSDYGLDTTNERSILGDLFSFTMPYAPLTDGFGNPATPSNIFFQKDGTSLPMAVETVDASAAYVSLFNDSSYWENKFINGLAFFNAGDTTVWVSFNYPYSGLTAFNLTPGDTIKTDESSFKIASILDPYHVIVTQAPLYNLYSFDSTFRYHIGSPVTGDVFKFDYYYLADGTNYPGSTAFVYGINYWQLPGAPITNGQGTNVLALPSDVEVSVDGTAIPDAVLALNAINGIVKLNDQTDFWVASPLGRIPAWHWDGSNIVGDTISFDYFQSGAQRYAMLFDDPARTMDDDMVFDGPVTSDDPARVPIAPPQPVQVGYKFRADLLHHASVLNSPDTLLLNNYQKPAKRASIVNRQDNLNHYNYFFSPEFLEDDDPDIVLNDKYLDKDIPPALTLNAGTPPFQKTYAYQPGMIREEKLQDIRQNHRLLMYCDLLLKEYRSGDEAVQLSSICDNSPMNFAVRFKEQIPPIEECDPWMLFDTAVTMTETVSIPSNTVPGHNLRILNQDLRDNFILRDMTSTGTSDTTYTYYEHNNNTTSLYLPDTTRCMTLDGQMVNFPALPVMRDATTYATASDVALYVDGVLTPGLIQSLDATTGHVLLYPQPDVPVVDNYIITQQDIDNRYLSLSRWPSDSTEVVLKQYCVPLVYGSDYVVLEDVVYLEPALIPNLYPGATLVAEYETPALTDRKLEFAYQILSTGTIEVLDLERSRVFDSIDVFAGQCYDGFESTLVWDPQPEYANFLSDYGKGIKQVYLNKDTHQLEEHVFSGPVFETYCAVEDEISSMDSFPDALIRVMGPLSQKDPLQILPNYDFLNNDAIRIRKKTLRELLPNRTFRTMEILEALPV